MTARVKPYWEYPDAPCCEECGAAFKLVAVVVYCGWQLQWDGYCPECDHELHCHIGEGLFDEESWPFEDGEPTAEDWEALGIEME